MLERRGIDEGLERRSRLTTTAPGAVERGRLEIAAADDREDTARGGIERDECRLQVSNAQTRQSVRHGLLRHVLQRRKDGGVHFPVGRPVAAELVAELLPQPLFRVAVACGGFGRIRPDAQRLTPRGGGVRGRDVARRLHPIEHVLAAPARAVQVRPRRERGRRLDETRDQRRFGEREIARVLPEQARRHRLDAVEACAEIHAVQVELEDLRLAQARLEHERDDGFLQLAADRSLVREEQRARELLCQRRCALARFALTHVVEHRARKPQRIDAGVVVEPAVLGGDERVLQVEARSRRARRRGGARRA